MTRADAWCCVVLVLAVASAAPGEAQEGPRQRPTAPFWLHVTQPEARRAQALLRQGRALLVPALGSSPLLGQQAAAHRRIAIEGALARFERARALLPEDPELLFLTGKALAAWEEEAGPTVHHRTREAIATLLRLREVEPWYEAATVAFELGVLYTREARFADAASEYQHALDMKLDDSASGATLGNLAEVTMLSGDLSRAVALYERASQESSGSGRILALWGLSVALDRLGERGDAIAVAQRAIQDDYAPMHTLTQGGVFFVPPFERLYYEGLGNLALAHSSATRLRPGAPFDAGSPLTVHLRELSPASLTALLRATGARLAVRPEWAAMLSSLHAQARDELSHRHQKLTIRAQKSTRDDVEASVLIHAIEAHAAFARYAQEATDQGPFTPDAIHHSERLETLLHKAQLVSPETGK